MTQSTTALGKKGEKLFPGPESSRNWISSSVTLIPVITYLCLTALQVFRGWFLAMVTICTQYASA